MLTAKILPNMKTATKMTTTGQVSAMRLGLIIRPMDTKKMAMNTSLSGSTRLAMRSPSRYSEMIMPMRNAPMATESPISKANMARPKVNPKATMSSTSSLQVRPIQFRHLGTMARPNSRVTTRKMAMVLIWVKSEPDTMESPVLREPNTVSRTTAATSSTMSSPITDSPTSLSNFPVSTSTLTMTAVELIATTPPRYIDWRSDQPSNFPTSYPITNMIRISMVPARMAKEPMRLRRLRLNSRPMENIRRMMPRLARKLTSSM